MQVFGTIGVEQVAKCLYFEVSFPLTSMPVKVWKHRSVVEFFAHLKKNNVVAHLALLEKETKLTLFILDSSISPKLFFLEVHLGSSLIDSVLLQEETQTKLYSQPHFRRIALIS